MLQQCANSRRIFIFDPCFGNLTGHWESYCKRLYYALANKGYSLCIYGQYNYLSSIVKDVIFQPIFKSKPFVDIKNQPDFQRKIQEYLTDLQNVSDANLRDGDILIFHSIFPSYMVALVEWLTELTQFKKIRAGIFFQIPPAESKHFPSTLKRKLYYAVKASLTLKKSAPRYNWLPNRTVKYYQQVNQKLAALLTNGHIKLLASTHVLADNFAEMLSAPVNCLPMPGYNINDHEAVDVHSNYQQDILRVGYFGHSSAAKGGQFLPALVREVCKQYPSVQFILQINPNAETEKALQYFQGTLPVQVKCLFGHIEEAKLQDAMQEVDIVLLPYSQSKYALTPSAIFMEAVMLKKVVVIPENTWMQDQALKYELGFVCFKKHKYTAILQALCQAIEKYAKLKQRGLAGCQKYYQDNCMESYIAAIERVLLGNQNSTFINAIR